MYEGEYAGVGSRDTPDPVCHQMTRIARRLRLLKWKLRSGGAGGADTAFAKGAKDFSEIFRASDCTYDALKHASQYHPAWDNCSSYAKRLHGRNSLIMLGRELNIPVKFVVCWTAKGKIVGGTGQALRIANDPVYSIPVFNLFFPEAEEQLWDFLESKYERPYGGNA